MAILKIPSPDGVNLEKSLPHTVETGCLKTGHCEIINGFKSQVPILKSPSPTPLAVPLLKHTQGKHTRPIRPRNYDASPLSNAISREHHYDPTGPAAPLHARRCLAVLCGQQCRPVHRGHGSIIGTCVGIVFAQHTTSPVSPLSHGKRCRFTDAVSVLIDSLTWY